ncbi:helix-turn-helix transcriptional regulator [Microlunatus sp. GCM10028923]|uniref:helix-turn-helix transcriptional regulator n=1 Tax=Microlunatus sp. GCM10028923 TaxID=3273400 RepID=UPI00361D8236
MTSGAIGLEPATAVLVADYLPGDQFGPRTLISYEFVWLLAGSARHIWTRPRPDGSIESGSTPLRPGQLVLVTPGTRDALHWDRHRMSRHAYVHFMITDPGPLPPIGQWPMVRDLLAAPILGGICDYLLELAGLGTEAAQRRSDELITLLVDLYVTGPMADAGPAPPAPVAAAVDHVREVWATDGMRIVPIEELAAAVRISAGHLHRVFRDSYGTGPARAFELIRLARGAVALQRSNAGLAEIARLVGYTNPYHFSRRFREAYGLPPGGYRTAVDAADPLAPLRGSGLLPLAGPLLNL